jgi:predicted peptidase
MRLLRSIILTTVLVGFTGIGSFAGGGKDAGTKDPAKKDPVTPDPVAKLIDKHFEKDKTTFDYLLYLPPGYEKGDKSWPLVLFLHGKGDKIERLKRAGLPRRVEQKKEAFVLVAPQQSGKKGWSAVALGALLDDVVANHKVDKDRIYVTGLSMGGFGTWSLAAAFPDKFAAIIPICGGGNPVNAKKIKDLPIWVFHGAKDQVVPASRSEAMVKALKDAGAENVKFTLYPNAGHDAWTATYSNQEVWDWLLKQKRAGK